MPLPLSPVRFGIVGFGSFAERAIAPALRASAGATLAAVQKRSLDAARAAAALHAIPEAYSSVEDLVRSPGVDAVYIVSANSCHAGETIAAAAAGKHVLVEKPMAMNATEAEDMIGACRRHGVRLMVGHMIRFSPLARRIRSIVQSGELGTITYARAEFVYDARSSSRSWLYDRRRAGGGPVYDIGVHCLDTLRYVLDDEVADVRATLDPPPTDDRVEHTAQIALRFRRGTIGSIFCSYAAPMRRRFIEVIGTDGSLSAPDFTVSDITASLTVVRGAETGGSITTTEEIVVPNLYVAEIEHFVSCIASGAEPESGGENGLANQRILDAAMRG